MINVTLTSIQTLFYFDGPQVVSGKDQVGTKYVCLLAHESKGVEKFLCCPVSKSKFSKLCLGEIDLRSVFSDSETGQVFIANHTSANEITELTLKSADLDSISEDWLPDPGFFVTSEVPTEQVAIREAKVRKRAIVHYSLNTPESKDEARILVDHLAQGVKIFQRLVRYSYNRALSSASEETKRTVGSLPNHQLEVFAVSPGSFKLHLQSSEMTDLLGYAHIAKALERIDKVTDAIEDPTALLEALRENKGHMATAYRDLLQFIISNDSPISYEWTLPEFEKSIKKRITKGQAEPALEILSSKKELQTEARKFIGKVTKIDVKQSTWRIESQEDGKEYSGRSDVSLSGITAKTKLYEFECEEVLEEELGTGRESTSFVLISFRELKSHGNS